MSDVVEAMARAMWEAYAGQQLHPADWPSWGELAAQGHQGMHRTNEFRGYARAAIRAVTARGGLMVGKMPELVDSMSNHGDGWNAAIRKVRANAVKVEGV